MYLNNKRCSLLYPVEHTGGFVCFLNLVPYSLFRTEDTMVYGILFNHAEFSTINSYTDIAQIKKIKKNIIRNQSRTSCQ
jgi:hypothetical protein